MTADARFSRGRSPLYDTKRNALEIAQNSNARGRPLSAQELRAMLGVSQAQWVSVRNFLDRHGGVLRRTKPPALTPEEIRRVIALYRGGHNCEAIAEAFGREPRTIASVIERARERGEQITFHSERQGGPMAPIPVPEPVRVAPAPSPPMCRYARSIMQRGFSEAEARYRARYQRAKDAEREAKRTGMGAPA